MLIDIEVSVAFEREIEGAVAREELQHVIEEADTGCDLVSALAFDGETDRDARLGGVALEAYGTARRLAFPGLSRVTLGTRFRWRTCGRRAPTLFSLDGHFVSLSARRRAIVSWRAADASFIC